MKNAQLVLPVYLNPNKDKSVKSADMLNNFSEYLRQQHFVNKISKEGFELNPHDFKWEYIINFVDKSGFMVLRENGKNIKLFVYRYDEDLNWLEFDIKDYKPANNIRLFEVIRLMYKTHII